MTIHRFTDINPALMVFHSPTQAEIKENGAKNAAERARPEFHRFPL